MKAFTEQQKQQLKSRVDNLNLCITQLDTSNPIDIICAMGGSISSLNTLISILEKELNQKYYCLYSTNEKKFSYSGFNLNNFQLFKNDILTYIYQVEPDSIDNESFKNNLKLDGYTIFESDVPFNEDLLKLN
jgi:hypothetical protein